MKVRVWTSPFAAELFGNVVSARVIDSGWSIAHRDGRGRIVEKSYGIGQWTAITFDLQAPAEPDLFPADARIIA